MKVKEIVSLLETDGWMHVRTTDSHRQFKHPTKPNVVTVPGKRAGDIPIGTAQSILKKSRPEVMKAEKTPLTRLLDLTAGWAEFVQQEEGAWPDPAVSVEELCDLYQEAGALMSHDLSNEEEARLVRDFVNTRLLSLLLRHAQTLHKTEPHPILA